VGIAPTIGYNAGMKSLSCSIVVVAGTYLIATSNNILHTDTRGVVMLGGSALVLVGLAFLFITLKSKD
jgi:hypothetical protein